MKHFDSPYLYLSTLVFALVLTGCSGSKKNPPLVDPGHDLVLKNVTIVDTHDGHLSPGMTVYVRGGKIAVVDNAPANPQWGSAPVIDGQGKFLVPGFVDAHTHILQSPYRTMFAALMLINGVTGTRQMSGSAEMLEERREGRLFESAFAPKVLAMPGRVLVLTTTFTPQQGVAEVDLQKSQGADFIKVALVPPQTFFAVGAEARKDGLYFAGHLPPGVDPVDAVNAGYRSIEHLGPGTAMLMDCSTDEAAIKQEIAEHPMKRPPPLPEFLEDWFIRRITRNTLLGEIFFDPKTISKMERIANTFDEARCRNLASAIAKSGSWQVPTLVKLHQGEFGDDLTDPNERYVPVEVWKERVDATHDLSKKLSAADKATIERYWQLQLRLARLLDEAGVPMLTGTDGIIAGSSLHSEFAILAQDGFSPLKVLQMTTLNAAKFFGQEKTMGSVEAGKDADLVLLDGNPIESAGNLDRINAVVRNGKFYSRGELDEKLGEIAKQAAGR
jgi:hypothetical protein